SYGDWSSDVCSSDLSRLRFTRDVANIVMDTNGVEQVNFTASGGADTITVNDLTGTGVTGVTLDLAGVSGSGTGDGQSDAIIVNRSEERRVGKECRYG